MKPPSPRRSRSRRLRETAGVAALLLLLPFAPVLSAWAWLGVRRERARLDRCRPLAGFETEGESIVLVLTDGARIRVDLAAVKHARLDDWGDGINGSRIDRGLTLDALHVCWDGWSHKLDPLVDLLRARGVLGPEAHYHSHPDASHAMLAFSALLGALVDLALVAILVARCG